MENETKNLMLWIEDHKENLASYMPKENIVHQAVWGSRVMDNLTKGVKLGSVAAIDLACELLAQDQ